MPHVLSRAACVAAAAMTLTGLNGTASAQASDPFIGQIMCAGFNFAPRGWAELNGQLLPIAQNTALFALLGTQYGGNGQTTFALPDMRGRVLMHAGQGPGLTLRDQGESAGTEQVTLNSAQLPAHNHTVIPLGSSAEANTFVARAGGAGDDNGEEADARVCPGAGNVGDVIEYSRRPRVQALRCR